jgi:hypothetical protein
MVIPFMVACGGDADDNQSKGSSTGDKDTLTTEVVDLGGREINILCWDFGAGNKSIKGFTGEIMYDENSSNSVDIAKKEVVSAFRNFTTVRSLVLLPPTRTKRSPQLLKNRFRRTTTSLISASITSHRHPLSLSRNSFSTSTPFPVSI